MGFVSSLRASLVALFHNGGVFDSVTKQYGVCHWQLKCEHFIQPFLETKYQDQDIQRRDSGLLRSGCCEQQTSGYRPWRSVRQWGRAADLNSPWLNLLTVIAIGLRVQTF